MRDPRNWVRPVAAVAIGTAAGAGLVVAARCAPAAAPPARRQRARRPRVAGARAMTRSPRC